MNTSELFDEVDLNHILEAVMDYKVRLMRGEVDTAGGYDVRKATVSALTLIEGKIVRALDGTSEGD